MCNEIVGVNGDEGTPVPIPNTVVKLVYGDNTWLATAREDNSTPTSKAATKVAAFSFFLQRFCGVYELRQQYVLSGRQPFLQWFAGGLEPRRRFTLSGRRVFR